MSAPDRPPMKPDATRATDSDEAQIRVVGLTKVYTTGDVEVRALDGVSLTVGKGEFLAIMGSSGSGKSTLMNVLGCLDRPTSGEYWLAGREVSKLDKNALAEVRNQFLGFVFQNFNLLSRTSALENVELPLLYQGVSGKERKRRATLALERVGLGKRLDHTPSQLSGGQQQRVAVARAVAGEPAIVFADEPTGSLDSKNGDAVMDLLDELHRAGATLCIVTHSREYARRASRAIHLFDGSVVEDHTKRVDAIDPADPLVAAKTRDASRSVGAS